MTSPLVNRAMSGLPFDQVAFLFLCIKNSPGKIDWDAVGKEYEMMHGQPLSTSAARNRFGRLKAKMELQEKQVKARKPVGSPKNGGSSKGKKAKVENEIKDEDEWIFQK
jgi:hypothetical protein